jgi:hypothetical protein
LLIPVLSFVLFPRYLVALVWLSPVLVRHVVVLPLVLLPPPPVLHAHPPST